MSLATYIRNTADKVFSQYVRIKEADRNGYCTCVTCGKIAKWNEGMDAGHYINRDDWATRFDDRNVHPQCACCNRFHSGRIATYAVYLRDRYDIHEGDDVLGELLEQSKDLKPFKLHELKEWVKEWRAEIRKMKTLKII